MQQKRRGYAAMTRSLICAGLSLAVIAAYPEPGSSQGNSDIETFFRRNIGLTQDQIDAIRNGQPVAKTMPPRKPAEVFLFGAVYIHATPESYLTYARDLDRIRKLPGYLALGTISNPPRPADWKGFSFDTNDISDLKSCKPSDCLIQLPGGSIEELQRSVQWSASDVNDQVNALLQKTAQQRLLAYKREGDKALGFYNDKREPVNVAQQYAYMLSYSKALPERLPDFYHYLLAYPDAKPENVEDAFYWARVKFGLKPTLRVVQVLTMRGNPDSRVAYATAEKQLYSSHYFETALDLSFCIRGSEDPKQPGFYLIMAMGSEQAGLTGVKGSIIRKTAVARSVSNLKDALNTIRNTLEAHNQ